MRQTQLQRRILALLLCVVMVFTTVPMGALATAGEEALPPLEGTLPTETTVTVPTGAAETPTEPVTETTVETTPVSTGETLEETVPEETLPETTELAEAETAAAVPVVLPLEAGDSHYTGLENITITTGGVSPAGFHFSPEVGTYAITLPDAPDSTMTLTYADGYVPQAGSFRVEKYHGDTQVMPEGQEESFDTWVQALSNAYVPVGTTTTFSFRLGEVGEDLAFTESDTYSFPITKIPTLSALTLTDGKGDVALTGNDGTFTGTVTTDTVRIRPTTASEGVQVYVGDALLDPEAEISLAPYTAEGVATVPLKLVATAANGDSTENHYTLQLQVQPEEKGLVTILKQPGTYASPTDSGPYQTDYYVGVLPEKLYFQVKVTDKNATMTYQVFYSATGSYDDALEAEKVTAKKLSTTKVDEERIYEVQVEFKKGKTYAAGDHFFFVEVTAEGDEETKTVRTDLVTLHFEEPVIDFKGAGTEEDPYLIENIEDLQKVRQMNAKGQTFSGVYFALLSNLELPGDWIPIGTMGSRFGGTFDGDPYGEGECITVSVAEGGLPLLGYVQGAQVRNLNIYGPKIAGYGLVNNFVGVGLSGSAIVIDNVTIKSGTQVLKSGMLGGYITTNRYAGVSANYVATIRNCTVEKGVIIGYNKDQSMIGAFAGRMQGTVENCVSNATVYGVNYVGGIIGTRDNALGRCAVTGCSFGGSVVASGDHAGGIAGGGYENSTAPNGIHATINNNTVTGTITGKDKVGGILGGDSYVAQAWDEYSMRSNHFSGTVSASGSYIGGIIGFYDGLNRLDDIADNTYTATCGAEKGIGFVKYLDTSFPNPTVMEGTIAFSTEVDDSGCPPVTGCAWKSQMNRTDDPLGADAEKLCKKVGASEPVKPTCYELKASGTYKTQYTVGEELNLAGIQLTAYWTDGNTTQLTLQDVTVSGYDKNKAGTQQVTIAYGTVKTLITVTVAPKSSKITVSVTIMGDSSHGENGGPHGMALGGLTNWGSDSKMEAQTSETVWDVLNRLAESKGISIRASYSSKYNSYYIEAVNGLGEFDNGPNSGWMYTVNGTHPEVGVSARYVKNGDKIILHYTDDFNYEEGGIYYGQPVRNAAYVDSLIEAIGTPVLTDACKKKIDDARAAYNALPDTEKAKVTKLSLLEAAEKKYQELKQQEDAAKAKEVVALIDKIGTVTASSGDAITAAQRAYEALTADQKKLVTNLSKLEAAITQWNQIKAKEVMDLIDKIGTPVTTASKAAIDAARAAYNSLTAEQKQLVTNYKTLTQAETAYAKLTASDGDKAAAQKVMDLIAAAQTQEEIEAARAAYEALTQLQKQLVENYELLESAEARLTLQASLGKVADPYFITGDYIYALGTPSVGSIGGEWMVIGLSRSGREVPNVEEYYSGVEAYVRENIDENQRLHRAKSTDNSRIILALTAIGKDVTNVAGHNLLQGLSDMDFVKKQGNNGPIWALLALDSGNYPVPEGGNVTRQALLEEILSVQTSDGGWAISGDEADSDMTGMALQALAPYYKKDMAVQQAVDKAVARLSAMQAEDGGFGTFSGNGKVATSESTSQVVVALASLGIDPDTDPRFVKSGGSAMDALLRYFVPGGGFKHIASGELDGMATEQGYYALTAYCRFLEGKTSLYDMTDVMNLGGDGEEALEPIRETALPEKVPEQTQKQESFPWVALVLALVLGVGMGMGGTLAVVLIVPKLKKKG